MGVRVLHRGSRAADYTAVRLLTLGDLAEVVVGGDDLVLDVARVVRIICLVAVRCDQ